MSLHVNEHNFSGSTVSLEICPRAIKEFQELDKKKQQLIAEKLFVGHLDINKVTEVPQRDVWRIRLPLAMRALVRKVEGHHVILHIADKRRMNVLYRNYREDAHAREVSEAVALADSPLAAFADNGIVVEEALQPVMSDAPETVLDVEPLPDSKAEILNGLFKAMGLLLNESEDVRSLKEDNKVTMELVKETAEDLTESFRDQVQHQRQELEEEIRNKGTAIEQILRSLEKHSRQITDQSQKLSHLQSTLTEARRDLNDQCAQLCSEQEGMATEVRQGHQDAQKRLSDLESSGQELSAVLRRMALFEQQVRSTLENLEKSQKSVVEAIERLDTYQQHLEQEARSRAQRMAARFEKQEQRNREMEQKLVELEAWKNRTLWQKITGLFRRR